jgi:hypothetical protein
VDTEARVEIVGAADVHDELASLSKWLGGESEFRGRVRMLRAQLTDGQMGGLTDALSIGLASGGALTVPAGWVSVWLRQRRSTLTVEIGHKDGSSQEVTAAGPAADTLAAKIEPRRLD